MSEKTILGGSTEMESSVEEKNNPITSESVVGSKGEQALPFDYGRMVGEGGQLSENWKDGLPEGIRGEKSLDSIKTIGALAQSYVHAQKSLGSNKVTIPGEHATAEDWDTFYKALGRPDASEDYSHEGVDLPAGITLDEEQVSQFRKFAYENGFSQRMYAKALAFDVARAVEQQKRYTAAQEAEYESTMKQLASEYGDRCGTVIAQCNKALETFGLKDVMEEKGLLNNYTIIKALAEIGNRIGESRLKGEEGFRVTGNDPAKRLAEIQSDPNDAYYRKDHPGHSARVAEVNNLLAALSKINQKK